MPKAFSNAVVITLMLFALVGQAFANAAMSCEMSAGSHQAHMEMAHAKMSHHQGMSHSTMNASSSGQVEDCCAVDCVCPVNACTSTTALNSSGISTDIPLLSEAIVALQSKQPKSISTPFYRPPIFA